MIDWKEFLKYLTEDKPLPAVPGPIMVSFVNRYLEPIEAIKYKIEFDGKKISGITSKSSHTITVQPESLNPIRIFAWSRVRKDFKQIDEVKPRIGQRLLVTERMKTFKHQSRTDLHPVKNPVAAVVPPSQNAPKTKAAPKTPSAADQGVKPVTTKNENAEPEHQTERALPNLINVSQLKNIFPAAAEKFLQQVADELNTDLPKYKLDTPLRRAHFFAQVRQEAGSALSPKQESLNYKPAVLRSKFSYYKDRHLESDQDGRLEEIKLVEKTVKNVKKMVSKKTIVHAANQQAIANKAYGGRGGNGSVSSGDGWRFRGRGIFQLTLRDNYEAFNSQYKEYWTDGQVDFTIDADKLVEFPYFIRSAVWYWISQSVYRKADGGTSSADVNAVTRLINGPGMDAAAERRHNFDELTYPAFK